MVKDSRSIDLKQICSSTFHLEQYDKQISKCQVANFLKTPLLGSHSDWNTMSLISPVNLQKQMFEIVQHSNVGLIVEILKAVVVFIFFFFLNFPMQGIVNQKHAPLKVGRVKTELIDVDLVRGKGAALGIKRDQGYSHISQHRCLLTGMERKCLALPRRTKFNGKSSEYIWKFMDINVPWNYMGSGLQPCQLAMVLANRHGEQMLHFLAAQNLMKILWNVAENSWKYMFWNIEQPIL